MTDLVDQSRVRDWWKYLVPTKKRKRLLIVTVLTVLVFLSDNIWLFLFLIWGFTSWVYICIYDD